MPSRRDVLKAGGIVGTGLLAGAATRVGAWTPATRTPDSGTWPQPRYGFGNTSYNPNAAPPREGPGTVWSVDVAESVGPLVVNADRVYVGTEHAVYGFERGDDSRWDVAAAGHELAVSGDAVVAVGAGSAAAFDAENGETKWRHASDTHAYGLLADRETAYVGWNGRLDAFDLATGDNRWSLSPSSGKASPGFDGDRLLVGSSGLDAYEARGSVEGVLSDAPKHLWQADDVEVTQPVDAGEYTLVGSNNCFHSPMCGVSAVDESGEREWRVELGNNAGSVATDGERAYVVSMLYGESEGGYNTADTTTLHALALKDGHELWSFQRPGWFCDPVAANGTVYVGESGTENGDGRLYALDADTGDVLWSWRKTAGVNSLVPVGDSLFVGTDDGRVVELA